MHFEGLSGAINVSIVAFSIVFGVLLVLTGTIYAMKLFSGSEGEKKNDITAPKTSAPSAPAPVAPAAVVSAPVVMPDKARIVAAITSAIVEFTGTQDFKILSVSEEIPTAGVLAADRWRARWKTAGILELNSNRLNRKWH